MESRTWASISRACRALGEFEEAVGQGGLAVVDVRDSPRRPSPTCRPAAVEAMAQESVALTCL